MGQKDCKDLTLGLGEEKHKYTHTHIYIYIMQWCRGRGVEKYRKQFYGPIAGQIQEGEPLIIHDGHHFGANKDPKLCAVV